MAPQGFPEFDAWQAMSESEQDALIGKLERARRRSDAFTGILVAVLVVTAISALLYVGSSLVP